MRLGLCRGSRDWSRTRDVGDAAEVRGPIPAVGRARGVATANADGVVLRVHQDRVVGGAVDPSIQDVRGRGESGREVLAGPRAECRVSRVGHALGRRTTVERGVREVVAAAHIGGHPFRGGGELVRHRERREAPRRAKRIDPSDEILLGAVEDRSLGDPWRAQAEQEHKRREAREGSR